MDDPARHQYVASTSTASDPQTTETNDDPLVNAAQAAAMTTTSLTSSVPTSSPTPTATGTLANGQGTTVLQTNPKSSPPHPALTRGQMFAAIFFPLLLFLACVAALLICCRGRRKRKAAEGRELNQYPSSSPILPTHSRPQMLPATESLPPIIIHRTSAMNSGYYTGIDTAAESAEGPPLPAGLHVGLPVVSRVENGDDPPPPYQPRGAYLPRAGVEEEATPPYRSRSVYQASQARSIVPDQTAVQVRPERLSEANLARHSSLMAPVRSLATSPQDTDVISELSARDANHQRSLDELSDVSDLSREGGREIRALQVV